MVQHKINNNYFNKDKITVLTQTGENEIAIRINEQNYKFSRKIGPENTNRPSRARELNRRNGSVIGRTSDIIKRRKDL